MSTQTLTSAPAATAVGTAAPVLPAQRSRAVTRTGDSDPDFTRALALLRQAGFLVFAGEPVSEATAWAASVLAEPRDDSMSGRAVVCPDSAMLMHGDRVAVARIMWRGDAALISAVFEQAGFAVRWNGLLGQPLTISRP